jgi:hypothetical protein
MRLRAGRVAAAVVVVIAVVAGTFGVVGLVAGGDNEATASTSLPRTQLIRLTRQVHCATPVANAVPAAKVRSFAAIAAVLCEPQLSRGTLQIVRRATGSAVRALQDAVLSAPGGRPTAQCFVRLLPTPGLVLVDASGRQLVVSFPRDACGQPDAVIRAALERRAWIRLPD